MHENAAFLECADMWQRNIAGASHDLSYCNNGGTERPDPSGVKPPETIAEWVSKIKRDEGESLNQSPQLCPIRIAL